MAEKCEVWKANDGTFWQTEAECLAWEMKLYLINLGKSAEAIHVDEHNRINAGEVGALARFALSALNEKVPAIEKAMDG